MTLTSLTWRACHSASRCRSWESSLCTQVRLDSGARGLFDPSVLTLLLLQGAVLDPPPSADTPRLFIPCAGLVPNADPLADLKALYKMRDLKKEDSGRCVATTSAQQTVALRSSQLAAAGALLLLEFRNFTSNPPPALAAADDGICRSAVLGVHPSLSLIQSPRSRSPGGFGLKSRSRPTAPPRPGRPAGGGQATCSSATTPSGGCRWAAAVDLVGALCMCVPPALLP